MQKILSAHRVTDPILVGIKTASGFNGGEQLIASIDFWNRTVIKPEQLQITKLMNKFTDINGLPTISIEPLTLTPESVGATTNDGQEAGNNNEF